MNESSDMLVLWILGPLFLAVGIHLLWYTRRRKKMLEAFAKTRSLRVRPERKEALRKTLEHCFSIKRDGLVRRFDQLSDPADGGSFLLFRAVELLDLNPHGQAHNTHSPRMTALFDVPTHHDELFLLDRSMRAAARLPASRAPDPDVAELARRAATSAGARHPLSVTLAGGKGLIYYEPLLTGGETMGDVDALQRSPAGCATGWWRRAPGDAWRQVRPGGRRFT